MTAGVASQRAQAQHTHTTQKTIWKQQFILVVQVQWRQWQEVRTFRIRLAMYRVKAIMGYITRTLTQEKKNTVTDE